MTNVLLAFKFFAPVAQAMSSRYVASSGAWWKFAIINTVIAGVSFALWYRGAHKKQGVTMYDMGVSFDKEKTVIDCAIIGKTFFLGAILFAVLYAITGFFQWALGQEIRFVWPLMLQVFIPEFAVLLFLHTWFYRRTGRVYLGAIVVSSMMIWFVAAGSVIGL